VQVMLPTSLGPMAQAELDIMPAGPSTLGKGTQSKDPFTPDATKRQVKTASENT
jgi:hypothetical protein